MPEDMTLQGDFCGFVTAVEAGFDPNELGNHADKSPGFTGQLRILGGLIWSDLYAVSQAQVAYPEDLWPLAMYQPCTVFIRPSGGSSSSLVLLVHTSSITYVIPASY